MEYIRLTSSDARHWMDSVEDLSLDEFKEQFDDKVKDLVLSGYIYDLEEHHGTYEDTIYLSNKYEDKIIIEYI